MSTITDIETLEALYGAPGEAATVKVTDHVTDDYARFIQASPFVALASVGQDGADCSPRGDAAGFVRVQTPRRLLMPDRRGNNRCDTLRNIVRDGRLGMVFLVPGSGTTLRVNGHATLSTDPALCESFAVGGAKPRCIVDLAVDAVYFQCSRAIARAKLWDVAEHVDPATLPSPGTILANISRGAVGGAEYDLTWPERARQTMW